MIGRPDGHYYYSNGGNPYIGGLASFDDSRADARAKSIAQRDYWLYTVGNNQDDAMKTYVSNPMISYTTGAKQVVIATTVLDQNNKLTGMFGGALPWQNIEQLINQLRDDLESRLPWDTRLFLISPEGIYWYHWDLSKIVHIKKDSDGQAILNELGEKVSTRTKITDASNTELATIGHNMIDGKSGYSFIKDTTTGKEVLILYHPIQQTGYSVALQIPTEQINQPVVNLIQTGAFITLIAILLVLSISYLLSRIISRPIVSLRNATNEITHGRWDYSLPSGGSEEVSELSQAFRIMIDTLKEREKSLETSKEIAEEASRAKSKFLSSMSHELRTPMNAILGFSQILKMDTQDEDTIKNIDEISAAGNHLLELINEILDLSKIESGKVKLNTDNYNLNDLVSECLTIIQPAANNKNIQINNNINSLANLTVYADKKLFKQVLLNLLSNAVKYNHDNGQIIIDYSTTETSLQIFISDTGKGIAADQMKVLFTLYERGSAEYSPVEGAGLGLVINKELIQLMGGDIGVESHIGKGSRFWITIPLS